MLAETEAIVLRQVKALSNRRMILLFSQNYGKISGGTSITEQSKSKSALAMRPFTLSRFELNENKGYINIKDAETIKSYYKIGEDMDKFANASYALEFIEKLLPEEHSLQHKNSRLFPLFTEYLQLLEERKKSFDTLTLALIMKSLQISGVAPQLNKCIICDEENTPAIFDITNAGYICEKCVANDGINRDNSLLYKINFDIVNIMIFLLNNPLDSVRNLELKREPSGKISEIIKKYMAYHLDIKNIKSESLLVF